MNSSDSDSKHESSNFQPLAWGILFFSFWLTLKTIPQSSRMINSLSWLSVIVSGIMWLSLILPPWRRLLNKPTVKFVYLPSVFFISITAYIVGWLGSLSSVKGTDFNISFWFGFVWLITYLLILMRASTRKVGMGGGVLFIAAGVYYLAKSNIIGGVTLIILGILGISIALKQPKWLWHESIDI